MLSSVFKTKKLVFVRKEKRSIDWKEVRAYLKKYVGDFYKVASTGDVIYADQNIHIVSKEQMRKRKQMLYKEFLK